ncbi:MAG: formate dehydrogenase accessory sulfurtransferase FdhD [Acidimicrobiaceae bacterium]|nr:formate dehydrogenase accessory sulfurtransferase FdhD [Acidimicrobiaceae bacterium]
MSVRSRSQHRLVRPWSPNQLSSGRSNAELATEEPMAIELDGVRVATTMRTPGHDFELAAGFCHTEGLLDSSPVLSVKYCETDSALATGFNVVSVSTGGKAPVPTPRLTATTSSCGFCGTDEIDELASKLSPVSGVALDWQVLADAPDRMLQEQALFTETGAVHAAGVVTPDGAITTTREDVGRHNAVDKVVGRLLFDEQVPAHDSAVVVSGRASFELVHKAWAAGFRALVSVSAPTALAVATAERAGMQLAGFARGGSLTVYVDL